MEHPSKQHGSHEIFVSGLDLKLRSVSIDDKKPTGMQIAEAGGFAPTPQISVLQWLPYGLEDVRPTETITLDDTNNRFIIAESDGSWRMLIDGVRYDWPASTIPVSVVRILGSVPENKGIFLLTPDQGEVFLTENSVLDLSQPGVENLVTRVPTWKLNVQGVILTINTPKIAVRRALEMAGVSTDQGWHIYLIVQGQDKREVELDSEIDLTAPGIEKLRLTPKDVSNGEAAPAVMRQFRLIPTDEAYLDTTYPGWQAIVENGRQWILLPEYRVPAGYSLSATSLAMEIPPTYPMAQIDMFYLFPEAALSTGAPIPATEARENIQGKHYQRWSRHRNGRSVWRPGIDNVMTHLALVESALLQEVQQ
jgi:hypothetical protein